MADVFVPPRRMTRLWVVSLLSLSALAVLLGIAAAFVPSGSGRRLLLVLLYATALAIPAVATFRSVERPATPIVGGAGYTVPRSRLERVLHSFLSLAYNAGLMIVVFAGLLRFGAIEVPFPDNLRQDFPIALGLYVGLLGLAAERRIASQGGVLRSWYTRVHGWFLVALSTPIIAAGTVLALVGEVRQGETLYLVEDDLLVLVLIGILGVGTQLFLAASMPTLFDLASALTRVFTSKRRVGDTPPVVYAGAVALVVVVLVGFLASGFDLIERVGYFRDERVGLLLVLIPVAAGAFFGSAAIQIWREGRRGLYKKRVSDKLRNEILVYGLATILGLTGGTLLLLNFLGRFDGWGPLSGLGLRMDLIMFTVVATAGPIGLYLHRQDQRVDNIEARLPDFLSDLAETRRAGLTMAAALHSCALSDYGPLTAEVKKMSQQVSWGVSFNEALAQFSQRVRTSLVERSVSLINEASRTGGSVAQILKAAAKDAHEIKGLESDRRVQMLTYLIVIYVVFGVFLLVISVLDGQFVPQVLAANQATQGSSLGEAGGTFGNQGGIKFEAIHFSYFLAAMVQSVGNGIVGGVLSEGQIRSGFRHAALMALLSWLVFRFVLAI